MQLTFIQITIQQIQEKIASESILKEDEKMYAQMWYDDIKCKADKEEKIAKVS